MIHIVIIKRTKIIMLKHKTCYNYITYFINIHLKHSFYLSAYFFEIHQCINYQEHYSTRLKIDLNKSSYQHKLYDIIKK